MKIRTAVIAALATVLVGGLSYQTVVAQHEHGSATSTPATSTAPSTAPAAKVVNTKCPIMGGKVNPAKVPDVLIREYKGQKIGFCCGGCPPAWDKLSDQDKDAKLSAVK